jgi:3-methyladenine DNA glycosylase AlkD
MATLAWHEKTGKAPANGKPAAKSNSGQPGAAMDQKFEAFFPFIVQYAGDERNFVKKAINWALRQIGKRNPALRKKAIATAKTILKAHPHSKAARFVANDALRELSAHPKTP